MAEMLVIVFLGLLAGSLVACSIIMDKTRLGYGSYYGNPNASRSQLYADFVSEIERCGMYVREREENSWLNLSYRQDEIVDSLGRLDEMIYEITLIAPENLIHAAKTLNLYVKMNYTKSLSFESAHFLELKSNFKDKADKDLASFKNSSEVG
jgi:hypothetical protein